MKNKFETENVVVHYGTKIAIDNISLNVEANNITSLIGPSGCGKSTFLRCLNRMNDTIDGCSVSGKLLLDNEDIYSDNIDPVDLRSKVGMVFQKPNVFPTSIYENVAFGLRIQGIKHKSKLDEIIEESLRDAFLWCAA